MESEPWTQHITLSFSYLGSRPKEAHRCWEHALLCKISAEKTEWEPCFKTQQQPILSSQKFPEGADPTAYWLCKDSNVQGSFRSGLENDDFYLLSTSKDVQGPLENFPNPSSYSREESRKPGAGGILSEQSWVWRWQVKFLDCWGFLYLHNSTLLHINPSSTGSCL